MRRFIPDSIAARTMLVLLLGLTVSHVASLAIYYSDRADALASLGGSQIAERIAAIGRLMEGSSAAERERVVEAVNGPTLRVTWGRQSLLSEGASDDWRARLMERVLLFHLGDVEAGRLRVRYADASPPPWPDAAGMASMMESGPSEAMRVHMRYMMDDATLGRSLRVSLQLSDQTWLDFAAPVSAEAPFWSLRFVVSISIMALAVLALSVWVVRRLTAPLAAFARASERLGVDVNAPPLPERGPGEVRRAVRTFNEMQERLRRYIGDRTRMLAAISHDLRTPITRLRLRSEFVEDPEQQRKMITDLDEMEAMIASVLDFARTDATSEEQETLELATLVQSICDDMADLGLSVEFRCEGCAPYVCRPIALRRALTNVIHNAATHGRRASVEVVDSQAQVVVRVDDDGPGIPEGELEKVFEPFYRLDRSRSRETGGAGLGLCVARSIVRAHGGDIALRNLPGGGLRAEVVLPRESGNAPIIGNGGRRT